MIAAPQEAEAEAIRERLTHLRRLVLERLIEILENGVPVQKPDPKSGRVAEIGRAPAPPAYLSAAIRFLKECGGAPDPNLDEELGALLGEAAAFGDNCDDEDEEDADES